MAKKTKHNLLFTLCLIAIPLMGYQLVVHLGQSPGPPVAGATGDEENAPPIDFSTKTATHFPTIINRPDGPPRVDSGQVNHHGQAVMIACTTCHSPTDGGRSPNFETHDAAQLDEFHQGLRFEHGNLACMSCHNPNDYDTLSLANRQTITYANVMNLCAQCHGPQFRDYTNGSHGGMKGYWDQTRGPRQRNNCIDCHDPHAPAYPTVMPATAGSPTTSDATHTAGVTGHE